MQVVGGGSNAINLDATNLSCKARETLRNLARIAVPAKSATKCLAERILDQPIPSDNDGSNALRFGVARPILPTPGPDIVRGKAMKNPTHATIARRDFQSRRHPFASGLALLGLIATVTSAQDIDGNHAARMAQGLELFKGEVRQLLVDNCLACHGGGQTLGGLDLSSRDALVASGKLGDPAESSALLSVLRHEREPFMPFEQAKLEADEIDSVERWAELGAPYDRPLVERPVSGQPPPPKPGSEFWSFQPLEDPQPPSVADRDWIRTPIDRFILSKLEKAGIRPNPSAGKRALIRRAYLDLLGLPPSPERVEEFAFDSDPDAFERLVEELLESPHYGERWARHWMDVARFAESYGFEEDYDRPYAYHYRDFLIKAFNRDMPYDRFVSLQVAGDELEPENPLGLMATGFMGAGAFPTVITEAEFEAARYDELDDMVSTLGTAMLGLTVGCARCHDHKHDPISSRDYYRMAAVFGRTIRTEIEYDPDPHRYRKAKSKWDTRQATLHKEIREIEQSKLGDGFEEWLVDSAAEVIADRWQVLEVSKVETLSGAQFHALQDGSILFGGPNVDFDSYTFESVVSSTGIRTLRVEALTHPSLPFGGPGRSHKGQFLLSEISVAARPAADDGAEPVKVEVGRSWATDELDMDASSVMAAINNVGKVTGWSLSPEAIGSDQAAVFEFKEPIGFESGTRLSVRLRFGFNTHYSLGRVRLSVSTSSEPSFEVGRGMPSVLANALARLRQEGAGSISEAHREALLRKYASGDTRWRQADAAIRDHEMLIPVPSVTRIQATAEGFDRTRHNSDGMGYPHFYEQTHFLSRGDVSQKGPPAKPGFLRVLMRHDSMEGNWAQSPPSGWDRSGFHRASLAKWITDPDSGAGALLARVIVNRLWHHHFGTGIVSTPSNFGRMGSRPSHPELLEWLAKDLVDSGWRLKRLHRLIMTSNTYRVSSATNEESATADPASRLRWRWTPRRLEAEAIRDSLLATAGLLDPALHGPSTLDEGTNRRSIYFFIKRSELVPSMMLFDWPGHLVGIGKRSSTTIAPQALLFLNSPQTRRYAEGFASRLGGNDGASAVEKAYRVAYARSPSPAEKDEGLAFLAAQSRRYAAEGNPDAEQLALVDYCQTLMSLNEFLHIR